MPNAPALILLNSAGLTLARQVQSLYPGAPLYGLAGRVAEVDQPYTDFGETLRALYASNTPIIACCAAGIIIRSLAPLLNNKGAEPPVLALAADGSAVVPLLGGLAGVNRMAREIAQYLAIAPAITTSGELRFGTCLLNPPDGYSLADLEQGKRWVSDLLNGETLTLEGDAPWLADVPLPLADSASRRLQITPWQVEPQPQTLVIHPRQVLAYLQPSATPPAIRAALNTAGIAEAALAAVLASPTQMGEPALTALAAELDVPLRFLADPTTLAEPLTSSAALSLHLCPSPHVAAQIGIPRGRLSVVGLGPGAADFMIPAVRHALDRADDILGYATYVNMAGPFRAEQRQHASDNREELQRAAHAFTLAAQGRRVVMVSSGDPGVFAMAAAVLEALENATNPAWAQVELEILPGVSAALATAARVGAPLGHDCCLLSLSDNLKPWAVIEQRLEHAGLADLVMALYNPISSARPWQLGRALEIVARHRPPETPVVLGRDIGRPAEQLTTLTLAELTPEQVDMRTLVIIGSSTTRRFTSGPRHWVYTPRWYRP